MAFHLQQTGAFEPAEVISGSALIIGDRMKIWTSDPAQRMPQWIELAPEQIEILDIFQQKNADRL